MIKDNGKEAAGVIFREKKSSYSKLRIMIMQVLFIILFVFVLHRLWQLQIVNGKKYAEDFELKISRTVTDKSTRGTIYDCNGEVLAYNDLVYTVTMRDDAVYSTEREHQLALNSVIYNVINKLYENNEKINNELKIRIGDNGEYEYTVSGTALLRFKADIFGKTNPDDMTAEQRDINASDLIKLLSGNDKFGLYGEGKTLYSEEEVKKYNLAAQYTKEEILYIVGIRYMLSLNSYKKYVPVVLSRDVSDETVAYILENNEILSGVDVGQDWDRVYNGGKAFSHILGYIGKISSDELEDLNKSDKKYSSESVVGKAGIEQYLDKVLQGTDGERQITVNNVGRIVGEDKIIKEAVSGKDVYLSIDKNLQTAVYDILEQNLAGIISSNLINEKKFDKEKAADTSDIKIPVYDVYAALIDNNLIQLENLYNVNATELEKQLAYKLDEKRTQAIEAVKAKLLFGDDYYSNLSEEFKEYSDYIVDELGFVDKNSINKEHYIYKKWKSKEKISLREYLLNAIDNGWITIETMSNHMSDKLNTEKSEDSDKEYFTADEMYSLMSNNIEKKLSSDCEFDKILFKRMLYEDIITEREFCRLLYDQKILSDTDDDLSKLIAGEIDAFLFIKKKIEQLEITPAQLALDPCSASAVILQAGTGKVLALVSYPGYDNNRLSNQMDSLYYNELINDKSLPLYNRATQQLTAPGSTFKPITIIAGLEEQVISADSSIFCDGVFDKVEPNLKCWNHSGHGNVINSSTALQFSCNDYLCEIAYKLGSENNLEYRDSAALNKLQNYSKLFCLDKKTGIEIAESKPHITDSYGIPSAIGQGTHNYATVQLARYANAIIGDLKKAVL